jgi:lipid II:glycine glycyltransferase (peptidoglycan interpeptide bridge formation enzyme)
MRAQLHTHNVILDITKSEEELLKQMHTKHRYNLKYSIKNGVVVKKAETLRDFKTFYTLLEETAKRQKYFIHSEKYYELIWKLLSPLGICHILTAYVEDTALASWMLFTYDSVLYYPYGGSSDKHRNLFASTQIAWESIKLGKDHQCKTFDMWGAAESLENTSDPWYGFTAFKLKFGGTYVEYMDSYDFVINRPTYNLFNFANDLRWKILKTLK